MIDALIRWSLGHRTIVVAIAAGFLLWGGWTASRIPLDVLPDLTAPTVTHSLPARCPNHFHPRRCRAAA